MKKNLHEKKSIKRSEKVRKPKAPPKIFLLKPHLDLIGDENHESLCELFDAIRSPLHQKISINFSEVVSLKPMATMHLVQLIKNSKKEQIRGIPSKSNIVNGMLSSLQVNKKIRMPECECDHKMVTSWHSLEGDGPDFTRKAPEMQRFMRDLKLLSNQQIFTVNTAISEAINNVLEHAYDEDEAKKPWKIFIKLENEMLYIVIGDLGKTIPATTSAEFEFKLLKAIKSPLLAEYDHHTDIEDHKLINMATNYAKSRTGQNFRGKGFSDMREICKQFPNSHMYIISRKGYWGIDHLFVNRLIAEDDDLSKIETYRGKSYKGIINGTIVSWSIPMYSKHSG